MIFLFGPLRHFRAVLQHSVSTQGKYLGCQHIGFFLIHDIEIHLVQTTYSTAGIESDHRKQMLEFPVLSDYCVLAEGTQAIYATHGHIYNEQKLPPLHSGDILLHGHTHVPKCVVHETEQYICMNPGSVSIPKEESWHGYMIWEGKNFVWKDFDGQEHLRYSV